MKPSSVELIGMCADVACGDPEPFTFEEIVLAFEEGGDGVEATPDEIRSALRVLAALGRIERLNTPRRVGDDLYRAVSRSETPTS